MIKKVLLFSLKLVRSVEIFTNHNYNDVLGAFFFSVGERWALLFDEQLNTYWLCDFCKYTRSYITDLFRLKDLHFLIDLYRWQYE